MTIQNALFSSVKMDWETPEPIFDHWDGKFNFTMDVCASQHNAKCEHYITREQDALSMGWQGRCWMNPPYGREIGKWLEKAYVETENGNADIVVGLIPNRSDTAAYHKWIHQKAIVIHLPKRIKFVGAKSGAPFPSIIVIWGLK